MLLSLYEFLNVQHLLSKNWCRQYSSKNDNLQAFTMKYECFICLLTNIIAMIFTAEIRQLFFRFDIFVPHTNFN